MATNTVPTPRRFRISLDVWAVTTAFALAALVRIGLLKYIPW